MATEQKTRKSGSFKFESFVGNRIGQVQSRLRWLDVGQSALFIAIVTLAYALAMSLLDLWLGGDETPVFVVVRTACFLAYLLALALLTVQLATRLASRINPYYAARELEHTLPDAKNSVINWLDLRDEQLPGAIRQAVSMRAAQDLKQTDVEVVTSPRHIWVLAAIVSVLFVGLAILFARGPGQFGSLLSRAFFFERDFVTGTQIHLHKPAAGNVVVGTRQAVDFAVEIEGRCPPQNHPGAPTLYYRYNPKDAFVALPMEEDLSRLWTARLAADQVQNGFWYKITAGDASTPEYQVQLRPEPLATRFEISYKHRPYLRVKPETVVFPNERAVLPRIKGFRGTEINLVIHTNSKMRDGGIELRTSQPVVTGKKITLVKDERKSIPGFVLPDDPQALRCQFTLERSGTWTVHFVTESGESNIDRQSYSLDVLVDDIPRVVLLEPADDVSLPANGTLRLTGEVTDDLGVQSVTLQMRIEKGAPLQAKPYRAGKSFRFDNGTYPDQIEYKDFIALDALKDGAGKPFAPAAGSVIEYWLEALDNCDYPKPNLGKSDIFKITILPPNKDDQKQKQERKQVEQEQKQHEKQEDQERQKQNQERNEGKSENKQGPDDPKSKENEPKKERVEDLLNRIKQEQDKQDAKKGEEKKSDPQNAEEKKSDESKKNEENKSGVGQQENKEPGNKEEAKNKKPSEKKEPAPMGKGTEQKKNADDGNEPKQEPGDSKKDDGKKEPASTAKEPSGKEKSNEPNKGVGQQKKEDAGKEPSTTQAKSGDPKEKSDDKTKGANTPGKEEPGDPKQAEVGKGNSPKSKNGKPSEEKANDSKDPQIGKGLKGKEEPNPMGNQAKGEPEEAPMPSAKIGPDGKPMDLPPQPRQQDPKQELTRDDVAKLKDQLGKKGKEADQAAKDLAKHAQETADPKLKKEIEDALKKAGREDELTKLDGPKTPEPGPKGEAKSPETKQAKKKELEPNGKGKNPGGSGPGAEGVTDDAKAQDVDKALSRRGGNLSLEDIKKYVTPEMLKDVGMTAEEYQKFLADAAKNGDWLKTLQQKMDAKDNVRGSSGKMSSTARKVEGTTPTQGNLQGVQAEPPPEFRESFLKFTTTPKK